MPNGLVAIHPAMLGQPHEWNYRRKDGSHVPVSMVVTTMHDDDGACRATWALPTTSRGSGNTKDSLRLAMHASQRVIQASSRFLASTSHDIRTPMNAVIGVSCLLGMSGD